MSKDATQVSESEWKVMEVVWDRRAATSQEIVSLLSETTPWSGATVKTMLHRLVQKRVLTFEKEGNRYLYRAAISRATCVRKESNSFMERVFSGNPGPLLMHFVKSNRLSPEEIQKLREILDDKEQG